MRPGVGFRRVRMAVQVKNFDNAIPNGLALKGLFHRDAFDMRRFDAVQTPNHVFEFFYVRHALIKSETVQKFRSIPAAIAGVQRNVE